MNSINRFSSRRQRLDHAFLRDRLKSAKSYKRIAGYFRSSIFELVGEEIASIDTVQIICNSELDAADVVVSKHAREMALKERWNGVACEVDAEELSRSEARDPKLTAVQYFLTQHRTDNKTWLEHGCIVFSQYYDTASSLGAELAKLLPNEPIGVYAGAGKSALFRGEDFAAVERDDIKNAVKNREIRLVIATDAACEGLNLGTFK